MLQASVPGNPLTPMSDQDRSLQNQILQTNLIRIVRQTVMRITNKSSYALTFLMSSRL